MSFPLEQLAALGFSRESIQAWKRSGVRELLPLQEKAIAEHGFLHGRNLLIVAPTSSGKTFVAEMAAGRHLERNRRAVYLAPTRALAEEKYRAFSETYAPLGYRVAVATRERPASDRVALEGSYDLLVAVYEKMKSYLVTRPEILSGISLVVVDELQMLGEPKRGAALDLLLTKLTRAPYSTQLIALSAVLADDASHLASWLGCDLLEYGARPLELREGVYDVSRQSFQYRNCNTGERGEETFGEEEKFDEFPDDFVDDSADFQREAIFSLVRRLAESKNEQALVFVPTRYMSRNWAHRLCSRLELPAAEMALDEIARYEDSYSRELLERALRHGVAFHNADLSPGLRNLVERHFNDGSIRILISTSTLGQGVNLRGRNVIHAPSMVTTDRWTGRQTMMALSRARFRNQGGRGARYSREATFGRSILVAHNANEAERMMRDYIDGALEDLTPQISPASLDVHALDLVASGVAHTVDEIANFFHDTFSGRRLWPAGDAQVARQIESTLRNLDQQRLVRIVADGRVEPTGLGEVAAATGLLPATVGRIAKWLQEGPRVLTDDPLEALLVLAVTPDARDFFTGGALHEDATPALVDPPRRRLLDRAEGATPTVESILEPEGGFTREALQDFRKALALDDWIGDAETRQIERQFQLFSGTIANLASHFGWLAQGAAAMARALALPQAQHRALDDLAERLALGCGPEGLGLRSLRVRTLSRSHLQALLREGYTTLESLDEADLETLSSFLPAPVAEEIKAETRRRLHPTESRRSRPKERSAKQSDAGGSTPAESETAADEPLGDSESASPSADLLLEVDLRGAGRVRVQDREVNLPRLAFRLLTVLARSPETGVSYEEIERRVWSDAQVERQQVHAHRRRLLKALRQALDREASEDIILVEPGRGLRLNLPADRVRVIDPEK